MNYVRRGGGVFFEIKVEKEFLFWNWFFLPFFRKCRRISPGWRRLHAHSTRLRVLWDPRRATRFPHHTINRNSLYEHLEWSQSPCHRNESPVHSRHRRIGQHRGGREPRHRRRLAPAACHIPRRGLRRLHRRQTGDGNFIGVHCREEPEWSFGGAGREGEHTGPDVRIHWMHSWHACSGTESRLVFSLQRARWMS